MNISTRACTPWRELFSVLQFVVHLCSCCVRGLVFMLRWLIMVGNASVLANYGGELVKDDKLGLGTCKDGKLGLGTSHP